MWKINTDKTTRPFKLDNFTLEYVLQNLVLVALRRVFLGERIFHFENFIRR